MSFRDLLQKMDVLLRTMWITHRSRGFLITFCVLFLPHLCSGLNLEFSVPHTAKYGHEIGSLALSGLKLKACYLYRPMGPLDPTKYFNVTSSGHLYTVSSVSALVHQRVDIVVKCESGVESSTYSSQHTVTIHIDNGHSALFFPLPSYDGHLEENLPANSVVQGLENLFASTESYSHADIDYTIISGAKNVFKLVKHKWGILTVVSLQPIDREETPSYLLQVKACLKPCIASAVAHITIQIDDVNDNVPYFDKSDYYTTISQSTPALSTVYFIGANDLDIDKVTYSMEPSDTFSIDTSRGHVLLNPGKKLMSPLYDLTIQATDSDGQKSRKVRLHIRVDVVLRFRPHSVKRRSKRNSHPAKEVEIPESYINTLVRINKSATDRFRFKEPSPDMLEINRVTGIVSLKSGYKLDYETQAVIEFTVVITKMNDPSCKYYCRNFYFILFREK